MRPRTLLAVVLLVALAAPLGVAEAKPRRPGGGGTGVTWAPAESAAIHPGVQTYTAGESQCTANFVFISGSRVFIGQAAHCASLGSNADTNGCTTPSRPLGTPVEIDGSDGRTYVGTLSYSSWLTMQARGVTDDVLCGDNDFALVELEPADVARTNPSVPVWGGPNGLDTDGLDIGEAVYSYGNSILRLGITALSPKQGVNNGDLDDGWIHSTTMITPDVPGDSGSGLLDAAGNAAGVLSGLGVATSGGTNFYGDLARELSYMHANGGPAATLVAGTVRF